MSLNELIILLADDDIDDSLFFEDAIAELSDLANFSSVRDGEQLMQLLGDETQKLPHILFLDLNMPRKNGFECLAEIKKNIRLKNLPVVIFSTSLEQEVVDRLYDNGAHFFIRKPSEFTLFKKIIRHTLTLIISKNNTQPPKENFVLTVENSLIT